MGKAVMRSFCLLAFGCLVGLFAYTYNLKLTTRALEAEALQLMNALQDESDFLALMRAEVSYLSRPDRIEDMAKKALKLEPIAQAQLVPWSAIAGGQEAPAVATVQVVRKDGIAALIQKAATQPAPGGTR
jgi:cell division protein FtsL